MKRTYGNFLKRLLRGGTKLTEVEWELLQQSVASLPPPLRSVVERQFEAYNLVQREVDGRALNFFRSRGGKANNIEGLPLLEMVSGEAPLVRLTARISGENEPLHATLSAVKGRVFCMTLSRRTRGDGIVTVSEVKQAWRSNFMYEKAS
jgi:hypothetical protein